MALDNWGTHPRNANGTPRRPEAWGRDDSNERLASIADSRPDLEDDRLSASRVGGSKSAPRERAAEVGAMPKPVTEHDAYFHPGGRIKAMTASDLARLDPTMQLPRSRAKRSSWLTLAVVTMCVPLTLLALVVALRPSPTATPPAPRALRAAATPTEALVIETRTKAERPVLRAPSRGRRAHR